MKNEYEVVEIQRANIVLATNVAREMVEKGANIKELIYKFEKSVDLLVHLFPLALRVKVQTPFNAKEFECAVINELIQWVRDHNAALFLTDIKSVEYTYLT